MWTIYSDSRGSRLPEWPSLGRKSENTPEGALIGRILEELARLAFLDIADAFNGNGAMKPLADLPPATRTALAGLEVAKILDPDGMPIGRLKKVRLTDKLGALHLLMRHLGMLNDKKAQGDADNPLTLLIKRIQGSSMPVVANPDAHDEDAPRRRLM